MLILQRYQCEICSEVFDTERGARACEAYGLPAPMPWFPLWERIPAFGENGVEWASAEGVYPVRSWLGHAWALSNVYPWPSLSHNQRADGPIMAEWFDPRRGYDAFRYGATEEDLRIWEAAMARHGFPESSASEWVRDHVAIARAKLRIAKLEIRPPLVTL